MDGTGDEAGSELATRMRRYRELFDLAPDAYLVTERDGVIQEANLAAARMLGADAGELIGEPLVRYVVAGDRQRMMCLLHKAVHEQVAHEAELLVCPRSGSPVTVSARVGAAGVDGSSPLRWLLRDIALRKDAEQRLGAALRREQDAAARLRELDGIKNSFLLAVSHDLRGPVTAMVTLARMLAGTTSLAPEHRRRAADSIIANAAHVERVQRNLVDLDRLARDAVAIEPERVDVGELVARTVAMADAADRTVSTRVSVTSAILDPAVVERILDNLVSNALNHTPSQSPVEVSVTSVRDAVLITVADHGRGVPPALRRTIFQAFGTAVPACADSPARGMGVGLHLVARFAALHGGRAWVDDTPGGGASFRVLLAEQP